MWTNLYFSLYDVMIHFCCSLVLLINLLINRLLFKEHWHYLSFDDGRERLSSQTMIWKGSSVNFDNEFDTGHKLLNFSLES